MTTPQSAVKVQRYSSAGSHQDEPLADVTRTEEGPFILHADHLASRKSDGERIAALESALEASEKERARLHALINEPEIVSFRDAVQLEAAHQRERWSAGGDAGKSDADWFWLIGHLGGKALHNPGGDAGKKLHRIVTVAAAACNWHAAILGKTTMPPGIEAPVSEALGAGRGL